MEKDYQGFELAHVDVSSGEIKNDIGLKSDSTADDKGPVDTSIFGKPFHSNPSTCLIVNSKTFNMQKRDLELNVCIRFNKRIYTDIRLIII